jgi:uncharacterized membrane protein
MGLVLAVVLGFVSGLRTFTSLAALALAYGATGWKIVASAAAAVEYVIDALPFAPSRTRPMGLTARLASGAVSGWIVAGVHGAPALAGAVLGAAASLAGTFGGHAARLRAIAAIGRIPAAIAEDIVAIALAVLAVTR